MVGKVSPHDMHQAGKYLVKYMLFQFFFQALPTLVMEKNAFDVGSMSIIYYANLHGFETSSIPTPHLPVNVVIPFP